MQLCGAAGLERNAQRHALAQQVLLPNDLTQRLRTQPLGQGNGCAVHA
jgi:hypothetical protein